MGYETGRFLDIFGQELHVEAKGKTVLIYLQPNEDGPSIRLSPEETQKAAEALLTAAAMYDEISPEVSDMIVQNEPTESPFLSVAEQIMLRRSLLRSSKVKP